MDKTLIDNWNKVVRPNDYIFHLGDFCFKGSQRWDELLNQLNGHKFLILGNHDMSRTKDGAMYKFDWVGMQAYIQVGGRSFYLNHFPFLCYGGMHRDIDNAVFALSGHVHLSPYSTSGKDISRMQANMLWSQYDVGVDANDFKPVSIDSIMKNIKYYYENNTNQALELIK